MAHPTLDLVRTHHGENYGWALACCSRQRELAEDVLQEAYLRVLDGRAVFSGKSTHRTWFFAVIKRVAADVLRAQKRRFHLNLRLVASDQPLSQANAASDESAHYEALARNQSVQQLQAALMQLSVRQREVLHLVFYAELTLEDAAQILDISLGSARTHYHRGKDRLAQLLPTERQHET